MELVTGTHARTHTHTHTHFITSWHAINIFLATCLFTPLLWCHLLRHWWCLFRRDCDSGNRGTESQTTYQWLLCFCVISLLREHFYAFQWTKKQNMLVMNCISLRVIWVYLGNLTYQGPQGKDHPQLDCAWARPLMTSVSVNSNAAFLFKPASSAVLLTLKHYTGSLKSANQLIGTQ